MAKAREVLQAILKEIFCWSVALAGASTLALILILAAGCSSPRTAPETTLTDAERACFSGTMQAHQKIGRDEKVSAVCK